MFLVISSLVIGSLFGGPFKFVDLMMVLAQDVKNKIVESNDAKLLQRDLGRIEFVRV